MTSIQPELWVETPGEAVAFYEAAFGATVLHRVGEGDDVVAQLGVGGAAVWLAATSAVMKPRVWGLEWYSRAPPWQGGGGRYRTTTAAYANGVTKRFENPTCLSSQAWGQVLGMDSAAALPHKATRLLMPSTRYLVGR